MYWPHFMEQIRGWHYHHQNSPTKAFRRPAGHEWPTDHPQPGTLPKASQEGPWYQQCRPQGAVSPTPASSPKINSQNIQSQKSPLRWESHAEIPRACPKHAFGRTYKVPAWNPQKEYDLRTTQTSRGHFKAIVKDPLVSRDAVHSLSPHPPGECCLVACSSTKSHSPRGHGNHGCNKVCQSDKVVID